MTALWVACRREMARGAARGREPDEEGAWWSALDLAQREVNQPLAPFALRRQKRPRRRGGGGGGGGGGGVAPTRPSCGARRPACRRRRRRPTAPTPPSAGARRGGKRGRSVGAVTCSRPSSKRSSLRFRSALWPPRVRLQRAPRRPRRTCGGLPSACMAPTLRGAPPAASSPRFPAAPRPPHPPPALSSAQVGGAPRASPRVSRGEEFVAHTMCPPRTRSGGASQRAVPPPQPAVQLNDSPETSPFFVCASPSARPRPPRPSLLPAPPSSPPPPHRRPLARPSRAPGLGVAVGRTPAAASGSPSAPPATRRR